jgi:CRP-like cAMP-binding protein
MTSFDYAMKAFIEALNRIVIFPHGELEKLPAISLEIKLKKGDSFISAGQVPKKIAFVLTGLFRYFYTDSKGNEFTKGLFPEGNFLSSYSAMIKNEPSHFTIEALEESTILVIEFEKLKWLMTNQPCWKDVLIAVLEKGFAKKEKREREFLLFDAETRYQLFRAEYPDMESRVKQSIVASYLGITPVALSRVRRKMGLVNLG